MGGNLRILHANAAKICAGFSVLANMQQLPAWRVIGLSRPLPNSLGLCDCRKDAAGNGSLQSTERSMIMTKIATFALALGLTASSAWPAAMSPPSWKSSRSSLTSSPSSSNAGLVVPALLLLGVIAAVASDDDDDDNDFEQLIVRKDLWFKGLTFGSALFLCADLGD